MKNTKKIKQAAELLNKIAETVDASQLDSENFSEVSGYSILMCNSIIRDLNEFIEELIAMEKLNSGFIKLRRNHYLLDELTPVKKFTEAMALMLINNEELQEALNRLSTKNKL